MYKQKIVESFHEGHCLDAHKYYGAHFDYDNAPGVRFTVYAPHAKHVQLLGSFNYWSKPIDMNRLHDGSWTVFVPDVAEWTLYKYRIEQANGEWVEKSDPFAFASELRPKSANLVVNLNNFPWRDAMWVNRREKNFDKPLNIYELHLGSWM